MGPILIAVVVLMAVIVYVAVSHPAFLIVPVSAFGRQSEV
jgi:hypothetical protein